MKRVLTTVLAVALLLGLGALAVLAMPSANTPLAAVKPVVSAAAAAPEAVDALENYNMIADAPGCGVSIHQRWAHVGCTGLSRVYRRCTQRRTSETGAAPQCD